MANPEHSVFPIGPEPIVRVAETLPPIDEQARQTRVGRLVLDGAGLRRERDAALALLRRWLAQVPQATVLRGELAELVAATRAACGEKGGEA